MQLPIPPATTRASETTSSATMTFANHEPYDDRDADHDRQRHEDDASTLSHTESRALVMHKREIDEPELRTRDALAQMVDRQPLARRSSMTIAMTMGTKSANVLLRDNARYSSTCMSKAATTSWQRSHRPSGPSSR